MLQRSKMACRCKGSGSAACSCKKK
jgi:hypothetical protein